MRPKRCSWPRSDQRRVHAQDDCRSAATTAADFDHSNCHLLGRLDPFLYLCLSHNSLTQWGGEPKLLSALLTAVNLGMSGQYKGHTTEGHEVKGLCFGDSVLHFS